MFRMSRFREPYNYRMQVILDNLEQWFLKNKLFVNTKKANVMVFSPVDSADMVELKMFGELLNVVNSCKYLGLIIDNKLKFSEHANYICEKISKKINYFYRIRQSLSMNSRIIVYKTIIAPHFEYCPTILFYVNENEKCLLQRQQNRAMRAILGVNRYTPIKGMLECLSFMSVNQRLILNNVIFVYKLIHNMLPQYMTDRVRFVHEVHDYHTRQTNEIYIPFAKKTQTQKSLFYRGLSIYNSLPQPIRSSRNIREFRKGSCEFVKSHYS